MKCIALRAIAKDTLDHPLRALTGIAAVVGIVVVVVTPFAAADDTVAADIGDAGLQATIAIEGVAVIALLAGLALVARGGRLIDEAVAADIVLAVAATMIGVSG